MSILTAAALAGIGIGAGAILFYHYLRKDEYSKDRRAVAAEMPVSISFSAKSDESILERLKPASEKPERKPTGKAPLNAACGVCKEGSMLPFKCKFCTMLFCGEHRLPESHDCDAL